MSNDKASQAREGILDSVAGKAKEMAGAVSGKDDLVEEGQLQQAEARKRKAAVAEEAIANAKREEAVAEVSEKTREAAEQKNAARAQAQREEAVIERQRQTERAVAAQEGAREESIRKAAAEREADKVAETRQREAVELATDATSTEQQAAAEAIRLEREAAAAEQQAAALRAQADK